MNHAVCRFVAVPALFLATIAAAAPPGWMTYSNARFGTALDYPPAFARPDAEPENGDGRIFRTEDGSASLRIYGGYNVLRETPGQALVSVKSDGKRSYTYTTANARFYVASGIDGANIFYERCNFSRVPDGVRDCFALTYPSSQAAQWNADVAGMGASLRNSGSAPR